MKLTEPGLEGLERRLIRITLSTKNVKNLVKMCTDLVCGAKDIRIRVKRPVEMPTKVLNIIPRKSSYGEGTNTWDKFELRVHEHKLTFIAPQMLSNKSPQSPLNLVSRLMSSLLIPRSTCLTKSSPTTNLGKMKYLII
ncbi:hypothetical protein MTR67_015211 [Solanum verrucosum]|uniref:Small ribosomal subunit protein uS10 domain-containing protein n=1 Tax=Solanum verrucosum TaxID=315347 RepID=A0AAF0QEK7_SOLVR|nr:hypothetical protein MTR67_015211 [Solanum verrucosum]